MARWCSACEPLKDHEIVKRRGGPKIRTRGIYRDAVPSSRIYLVKVSGLRWISLMWLGNAPLGRTLLGLAGAALDTALAPPAVYYRRSGRTPQKLTDRARQIILQLRRWLSNRIVPSLTTRRQRL